MIDQKKIRTLLKKTENKFISERTIARILKLDYNKATEMLTYLEKHGFIEVAEVDGCWQLSLRGKLLSNKRFNKEYKIETLREHLRNLIERVDTVNVSKEYPYHIDCMKITSEYPFEHRSSGIHVAYSICRKKISKEEYRTAANELIRQHTGSLSTILARTYYPHEAIRAFLQSKSHVLKLRQYQKSQIEQLEGYKVFGEE